MVRIASGFLAGGEDSVLAGGRGFQQTEDGNAIFNNILARGDIEANSIDLSTARIRNKLKVENLISNVRNWETLWTLGFNQGETITTVEETIEFNRSNAEGADLIAVFINYTSSYQGDVQLGGALIGNMCYFRNVTNQQIFMFPVYNPVPNVINQFIDTGLLLRLGIDRDEVHVRVFSGGRESALSVRWMWRISG